jgi:transitional endoplasmic reticulum ATPase
MIDPALIRSGRFDRLVMIGEPDTEGREQILKIHTGTTPLSPDVSLRELAEITEGYVGSDLESIAREAAIEALREDEEAEIVEMRHFRQAMENVRPTITDDIRDYYERMQEDFKGGGPEPQGRRGGGRIGFQ